MCDPQAQEYFGDSRTDDAGIESADLLFRHCRTPVQVVPLKDAGKIIGSKISPQAFIDKGPGVSIDLACLMSKNVSWEDRYGLMPNTFGMISVSAGDARRFSSGVAWTPKPQEDDRVGYAARANEFHGEIINPISKAGSRDLLGCSTVLRLKAAHG